MEILLDTHMLLWWLTDDPRLSRKARALMADPANVLTVSAATAWEVAIKQTLGWDHCYRVSGLGLWGDPQVRIPLP